MSPPPAAGRTALLLNARARRGPSVERTLAGALTARGLSLDFVVRVRRPRGLTRAVAALLARGIDRLIVGGGDGTLGTVAPWLARRDCLLGVIPLGTANDFARALGIPMDPVAAAAVAAGSHARAIDLGRANDAYFLNVASLGMSVAALNALGHDLKRRLGPAAYAVAGARAFLSHPTFRVRLSAEDLPVEYEGEAHQVVVANGRFYGGGVLAAGPSTLDDGVLHAYVLGTRGRWELLRTMALLRLQVPLDRPGDSFLQTRSLRVETRPRRPVNLDGELRTRTPVEFALEPGALRVLTPDAPAPGAEQPAVPLPVGDRR